jgi:hypothetical protein
LVAATPDFPRRFEDFIEMLAATQVQVGQEDGAKKSPQTKFVPSNRYGGIAVTQPTARGD